jgi:hypothetical protein
MQWFQGSNWVIKDRPRGRTGRAASNHCTNSGFIEHILDWRPFDYYTVRLQKGKLTLKITGELEPVSEGTRVRWKMKLDHPFPRWLRRPASRIMAVIMRMRSNFERMDALMVAEDRFEAHLESEHVHSVG